MSDFLQFILAIVLMFSICFLLVVIFDRIFFE